MWKPSLSSSAISIVFLVDIIVDILGESVLSSFLMSPTILQSCNNFSSSSEGNLP